MTLTVSEQHNLQSTLSPINSRVVPCESSSSPRRLRTEAYAHGAASCGSMAEKKNGLLIPGRRVHPSSPHCCPPHLEGKDGVLFVSTAQGPAQCLLHRTPFL